MCLVRFGSVPFRFGYALICFSLLHFYLHFGMWWHIAIQSLRIFLLDSSYLLSSFPLWIRVKAHDWTHATFLSFRLAFFASSPAFSVQEKIPENKKLFRKTECIHFIIRYFVSCSIRQHSDMQLVVRIHDVRVNDSLDQICKMVSNYPNG